jgi:hypothetical protein
MSIEEYYDDKREFEDLEPDDHDYHEDDHEPHGLDCDCPDCLYESALTECGLLPDDLGGGCTLAGTEYCDFRCPLRDNPDPEA